MTEPKKPSLDLIEKALTGNRECPQKSCVRFPAFYRLVYKTNPTAGWVMMFICDRGHQWHEPVRQ